ncbi:tRNA lysidine(34) synthetase TilS [Aestuariivivens marinum]|uniref:tRNA lysidine(34) synthetase TilS n=1 Tax=Aestuariivivens marinum TaxID=2913555 RepID=UPI001F5741E0|nr:tRNA lysidine(34) synthetase TilS [Aestuariivivens marinum]
MFELFKNHIDSHLPFLREGKLLVAISGGLDSVVLTHLCHKLKLNIALAHCNFNLRGDESDSDETFVLDLAEDLYLEVFVESFDTKAYAKTHKCSIQMAARELRYHWFSELAEQLNFDYILTAHHADDNLETFLINFTRGTGIEGLMGIPKVNGKFVRPLLMFSSTDIENYAITNTLEWKNDSSNQSAKYLRNKLRHQVVPVLKEINPSLLQSFSTTLNNLTDVSIIVSNSIDDFLTKAIERITENEIWFRIAAFKKQNAPGAYLYQVFKDYGFTEWNDVLNLLDAQPGKQLFSNTHRLIKDREYLLLTEINVQNQQKSITIPEYDNEIHTPIGMLSFNVVKEILKEDLNTIYVDAELLKFPLIIRKKQEGDYFYPLGMTGKKKLSKYFKDEKLSLLDKEDTWLLCSGDSIVWVVGRRADNRFRVNKNTSKIFKITLR